jgi:transposase
MESSGKYWIPVFNILEKTCHVTLAHPKYTKPQRGNKTDRKDAKWICDLFMCDMIKPSFIPPPDIRHLRDLVRYRFKLTNCLTGEKNRAQNCLTVSNLKLDDVFSDVFGKSASSIIHYILEHPGEPFDVAPFVDRRCKHSIEEIQAAVDGFVAPEQATKLREILRHIEELKGHKLNIETEILRLANPYQMPLELMRTVPGFSADPMTSTAVLSEIGADMSVFPTAKNLCSWAGCCPRNDQSGGKRKSSRISRAGVYLKPLLVQVANAVVHSDKYPECKERYRRIKARRGHKKAIIAICRMLLTAIWNILSKLEPYSSEGYLVDRTIKQSMVITKAQGLNLLRLRGYLFKDEVPSPVPI